MRYDTFPRQLLGQAGLISFLIGTACAADWNVIAQNGRDYVSFENVAAFYRFGEYSHANRTISLRSDRRTVRAQVGTSEIYINGVRFFTCHPLLERAHANLVSTLDVGKIIEPVLRPSRIEEAARVETVVLDPGHGGVDAGASNAWGNEKTFALEVALAARDHLLRAGFKVEMTRGDDTARSIEERIEFANRFANAVFVSIHFNSGSGGAGVESFRLAPDGVPSSTSNGEEHPSEPDSAGEGGNAQDSQNIALTAAVHAAVLARTATYDRGIRHARFKVLRHVRLPAVLLEAGFLNDSSDGPRIASPHYRQQVGLAIAQGVQSYNTAVNYRAPDASFLSARTQLPLHSRAITEALHVATPLPSPPPHEPSLSIQGGQ